MSSFTLQPDQTILLIIDMQEKIFVSVDRGFEVLNNLCKFVRGSQFLNLPIVQSEQYPEGLGKTVAPLQTLLDQAYQPWVKSTFSCIDDPKFLNYVLSLPYQQWIVTGIEAHICVLQTVKGLLKIGKQVTVLNDAVTSRSSFHFTTAIAEMHDAGARTSCAETVLFELLQDSKHPQFKSISNLVKTSCNCDS